MLHPHQCYAVIIVLAFLISSEQSFSQNNIKVQASQSVNILMSRYIEQAKSKENVKVWRIQIISTPDRREMENSISQFKAVYPEMTADWRHVSPNYQLRTGYYDSKNKLIPLLLDIKKSFPAATSVYDNVSKKALLGFK